MISWNFPGWIKSKSRCYNFNAEESADMSKTIRCFAAVMMVVLAMMMFARASVGANANSTRTRFVWVRETSSSLEPPSSRRQSSGLSCSYRRIPQH